MVELSASTAVGDIVAEAPSTARVFERVGVDYCCGGRRSLSAACEAKSLTVDEVIAALREATSQAAPDEVRWTERSMSSLIEHLVATHHVFTRDELERATGLMNKVLAAHAATNPELAGIARTFEALRDELIPHLQKEEVILFPYVRALDGGASPRGPFPTVMMPVRMMDMEHDSAGKLLATLREQTRDYALPEGACGTWRALWDSLQSLERDLHMHIHLESNVLFPRAVAAEAAARSTQPRVSY